MRSARFPMLVKARSEGLACDASLVRPHEHPPLSRVDATKEHPQMRYRLPAAVAEPAQVPTHTAGASPASDGQTECRERIRLIVRCTATTAVA